MRPFREGDTFATFRAIIENVTSEINALDNEYILKASQTEIEQHYIEKVLIKPLILHTDQLYIENQSGTRIDVSHDFNRFVLPGKRAIAQATRVDVAIPYEGSDFLWRVQASTFSESGHRNIDIRDNEIVVCFTFPDDSSDPDKLRGEINRQVKSLEVAVANLRRDVDNHNQSALATIRSVLQRKKQLALSATGAVAALGIPIKRKGSQPTFTIPAKRRQNPARRPAVAAGEYKPEPTLDEKEYEYILDVIRSMSLVIERNPASFTALDEEAIRDHFLIQPNGHYEGSATGETFNAAGKTDILIRADNRNVFIAECKFWRGQKVFNEAINQLIGYLSWRDSKCALLVFNKTKDSNAVRQKMHEIMAARPEHRKTKTGDSHSDSRYVFVKESDPGREIIIATQLYDIPTQDE